MTERDRLFAAAAWAESGQPHSPAVAELVRRGIPPIAGGDTVQNPVANPLGGATVDGTTVTVDVLTNPPTRIPAIIRQLVGAQQGYFIERVFNTPGMTVQGGAILYTETFPEDYFAPEDQSIAPRAPGSEAPILGATRHEPKVKRVESWAGSIEVHDEARRRNNVDAVQRQFTQAANTFADRIQTRGMETLQEAVDDWGRTVTGMNWAHALPLGVPNADPADLPQTDFARVEKQFLDDKAGRMPNLLVLHTTDNFNLKRIYGDRLPALLDSYGLTPLVSPRATEGAPYFVEEGAVGVMAFEKPLGQEYTREGKRFTDVYTLESVPVLAAIDASAIIQLQGTSHS